MEFKTDAVLDLRGNAIFNASVRVLNQDKSLATVYDAAGSQVNNPVGTDATGEFSVAVPNGKYFFEISVNGTIYETRGPISFFDPIDGGVATVKDFGAKGDGTADDYLAFQRAVDALPSAGGYVGVPEGNYLLSSAPSVGIKSIEWGISTGALFSGNGALTFPRMSTNPAQLAVGPYIRSQSRQVSPPGGGIAAWNVEMIQPPDYAGQSVAAFYGARGSSTNPASNVWTLNPLIRADAGARGTYQCLEIDVDCFSADALVKGISLNGAGPANPDIAIEIIRTGESRWDRGIDINQSVVGLRIRSDGLQRAIVIGDVAGLVNTIMTARQLINGFDSIVLQRATDSTPAGFFHRAVNAANTETLFSVDVLGQIFGTGATVKSDQSTGFTALVAENSSTAGVVTKTTTSVVRGRDTVNGLKNLLECVTAPSNSNLISSSYTVRTRFSDAMVDSWQIDANGNQLVMRLGAGLRVKEGTNAKQGVATLSGGTVTVGNTSVTANSRIFLTPQDNNTIGPMRVSARTPGTSFTITSGNASDNGVVAYEIFEPA